MSIQKDIGRQGEETAAQWLSENGFTIRERNWRHGRYEIDIIAEKDGELHIVEVKCRAAEGLTRPEEAITRTKFEALKKAAEHYIETRAVDADVRFDLASVTHRGGKFQMEFVPDAMVPGW